VPVGPAKFELNRCNESPLQGEKPDFWPVSKFNTRSLPLRGILPVINNEFTELLETSTCNTILSNTHDMHNIQLYIFSVDMKKHHYHINDYLRHHRQASRFAL